MRTRGTAAARAPARAQHSRPLEVSATRTPSQPADSAAAASDTRSAAGRRVSSRRVVRTGSVLAVSAGAPAAAGPAVTAFVHAGPDRLPASLEVAVGEAVHVVGDAESGLDPFQVDRLEARVDADVVGDAVAVTARKVGGHRGDF